MSHRDPETHGGLAGWVRRGGVRPSEIAVVLICVTISVALGLHRKAEHRGEPPAAVEQWPAR